MPLFASLNYPTNISTLLRSSNIPLPIPLLLIETHPDQLGSTEHGAKALISIVDCLLQSPSMAVTLKRALLGGVGAMGKVVHASILATTCDRLITKYESVGRDEAGVGPVIAACLLQIVSRAGDRLLDDTTWTRLLACSYAGLF